MQKIPWRQLEDLDFPDDIALISHTCDQMQRKTTELEIHTRQGLLILEYTLENKVIKVKTATITVEGKSFKEVHT